MRHPRRLACIAVECGIRRHPQIRYDRALRRTIGGSRYTVVVGITRTGCCLRWRHINERPLGVRSPLGITLRHRKGPIEQGQGPVVETCKPVLIAQGAGGEAPLLAVQW